MIRFNVKEAASAGCCATMAVAGVFQTEGAADELVLVKDGVSLAPVVVFQDAPPKTLRVAEELVDYIEKISGARPELIEGTPEPIPESAIWVGYQPVLNELFPELNFEFEHPEEILIAANDSHLVIAGRDRWDPDNLLVEFPGPGNRTQVVDGVQQEYGTCNAVYTFLQDYLDIRWLWPGPSGEDIIERETIAFAPFEYRYHPQFRARAHIFNYSTVGSLRGVSHDWSRLQRLRLDSLNMPGGHAFSDWWERFHESEPELFALQPDGSRGGYPPNPKNVGLCKSNPAVLREWLADVEEQLRVYPARTVFNASPNDSISNGTCVCEECVAMDHPDGAPTELWWQETGQEYVALTDRFVTFANRLAGLLTERYPEEDFHVSLHAYGSSSRPPPVEAVPAENMFITFTGTFPWRGGEAAEAEQREQWLGWVDQGAGQMVYRPNIYAPLVRLDDTMDTFKFFAENKGVGFFFDMVWEHWAINAPQHYLMAALAWNPDADEQAIMEDYYQRGFGPAAGEIRDYWRLFEDANKDLGEAWASANSEFAGLIGRTRQFGGEIDLYPPSLLAEAGRLLDEAEAKVRDNPKYAERVAFVRAGYDFHRLRTENFAMMLPYLEGGKQDAALADKMRENMETIQEIIDSHTNPPAFNPMYLSAVPDAGGRPPRRMAMLHPDFASIPRTGEQAEVREPVKLQPAEETGWTLAFHDDFQRSELGEEWKVIEGHWEIIDGFLRGGGTLVLDKDFGGADGLIGQRVEFEATTDVEPILLIPGKPKPRTIASDLSSFVQAQSPEQTANPFLTGYFFQFGGFAGTRNRLLKGERDLVRVDDPEIKLVADTPHQIVVENDGGRLRLFVDGELALEYQDDEPATLSEQDRVGFYFYTASKVPEVKVYIKQNE